jgi:hypothetical protein
MYKYKWDGKRESNAWIKHLIILIHITRSLMVVIKLHDIIILTNLPLNIF